MNVKKSPINDSHTPIIFYEGNTTELDLNSFKKNVPIWIIRDLYATQLKELFKTRHPKLIHSPGTYARKESAFIKEKTQENGNICGSWIYFPWSGILTHIVNEEEYFELRTNRNRHLITSEEQKILSQAPIGILGLSVGSHIALALSYSGIGNPLILSDFDSLDTTNLNRVGARVDQIGMSKAHILAERIYEINPYARLILFENGVDGKNLELFMSHNPSLIYELMDSYEIKIKLRIAAQKARIPIISLANIGDAILADVERYDLYESLPFFNGTVGTIPEEIMKNPDSTDELKHRYAVSLAGKEHISKRAYDSVKDIGTTLTGRPQLMSTVAINGGLSAYIGRQILLKQEVPSKRQFIELKNLFL